jgi:hypothetical protein
MAFDIEDLPEDVRDELERLRSVNRSMGAYLKLVEGALLAAWEAGEREREVLFAKDDPTDEEQALRNTWELVREVVIRISPES